MTGLATEAATSTFRIAPFRPLRETNVLVTGGRRVFSCGVGCRRSETPVDHGLAALARTQRIDGSWAARRAEHDVGVTGLVVVSFLGDGTTHQSGRHRDVVKRALRFLKNSQATDGGFPTASRRELAWAALALVEAYAKTGNRLFRDRAQDAVHHIERLRIPGGGWSERPGEASHTTTTAWMLLVLKSAQIGEQTVDRKGLLEARAWLESMVSPVTGRAGHQHPGGIEARNGRLRAEIQHPTGVATAAAVYGRFLTGQMPLNMAHLEKSLALVHEARERDPPGERARDLEFELFGTLAAHQVGGADWKRWTQGETTLLTSRQVPKERRGIERGSWAADCLWGDRGGRAYSTAMHCLLLEVHYRYRGALCFR